MRSNLRDKLKSAEQQARAARERHKVTLRAVKQLRALSTKFEKVKKDPGALNVELAFNGDILFDFDLEDYPELNDTVMQLCEQLREAAMSRIDSAVTES